VSAAVLRRRYRRLLAVYPSDWRAANEAVVLDTLLEAAGPTRRWPPPREALALLLGGVRVWIGRPRPDAGDRGRRWLDGLQLGAILLALWSFAAALGQLVSWAGHGFRGVSGPAAASGPVVAVLAAVTFVSLLRGRVGVALVAVAVWVLAGVLWAIFGNPEGTTVDGLVIGSALAVWLTVVWALPLLAVLAVLVRRGGARSRSWAWLLLAAALAIGFAWAPVALAVVIMVSLAGLVAALVLAVVTGEVRPAVALAVVCLPWILGTALGMVVSSAAAALAVASLAAWGARRARHGQGPGPGRAAGGPAGGPAPQNDA
jgi:uncharacterized membrane protein YhaH (DUF805 family)